MSVVSFYVVCTRVFCLQERKVFMQRREAAKMLGNIAIVLIIASYVIFCVGICAGIA